MPSWTRRLGGYALAVVAVFAATWLLSVVDCETNEVYDERGALVYRARSDGSCDAHQQSFPHVLDVRDVSERSAGFRLGRTKFNLERLLARRHGIQLTLAVRGGTGAVWEITRANARAERDWTERCIDELGDEVDALEERATAEGTESDEAEGFRTGRSPFYEALDVDDGGGGS